jgi:hypothetical protein
VPLGYYSGSLSTSGSSKDVCAMTRSGKEVLETKINVFDC